MGCHIIDPAFWALKLGHPTRVEATTTHYQPEVASETYPRASIVRYEFPARGDMPPVKLTWFDGRLMPPRPKDLEPGRRLEGNGALLHRRQGHDHARLARRRRRADHPGSEDEGLQAAGKDHPARQRRPGGHEQDWIRACKDGKPASSTFDYGGPLTEMVLLGVLAMRIKDTPLEWDPVNLKVTNNSEANKYVNPVFREGWTL